MTFCDTTLGRIMGARHQHDPAKGRALPDFSVRAVKRMTNQELDLIALITGGPTADSACKQDFCYSRNGNGDATQKRSQPVAGWIQRNGDHRLSARGGLSSVASTPYRSY